MEPRLNMVCVTSGDSAPREREMDDYSVRLVLGLYSGEPGIILEHLNEAGVLPMFHTWAH